MKFAFMIMGQFDPDTDRALMHGGTVQMIGVSNMDGELLPGNIKMV